MAQARRKREKVRRIDQNSATFKWIVPASLITLSVIMLVMVLASLAVIFDILPRG